METLHIRRLNREGIARFEDLLFGLKNRPESYTNISEHSARLLSGSATSEPLPARVDLDSDATFSTRMEMAAYLFPRVSSLGLNDPLIEFGLWEWISLAWLNQLTMSQSGRRVVGATERYILGEKRKRYRHLVLGAFEIYAANISAPEKARCLLYTAPTSPGELVGQLGAKGIVVRCRAAVSAATTMYLAPSGNKLVRGAGSNGAGSARRLNSVLGQFDRTYDLSSITDWDLLQLLPAEFDKFKPRELRRESTANSIRSTDADDCTRDVPESDMPAS